MPDIETPESLAKLYGIGEKPAGPSAGPDGGGGLPSAPTAEDLVKHYGIGTRPFNTTPAEAPQIPDIKDRPLLNLPPEEEQKFQNWVKGTSWHKEFTEKHGEPDLNDPSYDLRRAWKAGVIPKLASDKTFHWADSEPGTGEELKSVHHPTAWMEPFMKQYPGANPEDEKDPRVKAYREAWQAKYPSLGQAPAGQEGPSALGRLLPPGAPGKVPGGPQEGADPYAQTYGEPFAKVRRFAVGFDRPVVEALHGLVSGTEKTINWAFGQSPDWTWQNSPEGALGQMTGWLLKNLPENEGPRADEPISKWSANLAGNLASFMVLPKIFKLAGAELPMAGARSIFGKGISAADRITAIGQSLATNLLNFGIVDVSRAIGAGGGLREAREALSHSMSTAALFTVAGALPFFKVVRNPWLAKALESTATGGAFAGSSLIAGQKDPTALTVDFLTGFGLHALTSGLPGKAPRLMSEEEFNDFVKAWKKVNGVTDEQFKPVTENLKIIDRRGQPKEEAPSLISGESPQFSAEILDNMGRPVSQLRVNAILEKPAFQRTSQERFIANQIETLKAPAEPAGMEFAGPRPEVPDAPLGASAAIAATRAGGITPRRPVAVNPLGPSAGAAEDLAKAAPPKAVATTGTAAEIAGGTFKHFTTPESKGALEGGASFDVTMPPQHGTGGLGLGPATGKMFGDRLYLSLDDSVWNRVNQYVGGGENIEATTETTKQYPDATPFYDYENQKWMLNMGGYQAKDLEPVDYTISPKARILKIDSLQALRTAMNEASEIAGKPVYYDMDEAWDALAKKYDAVAVLNTADLKNESNPDYNKFFKYAMADQVVVLNTKVAKAAKAPETGPAAAFMKKYGSRAGKPEGLLSGRDALQEAATLGNKSTATTAEGTKVPFQYAVVELGDVIASHDTALNENPNFPKELLQPRDRDREASQVRLANLQNRYDTDYPLTDNPATAHGAPVLGPDMFMESGNGRTIINRRLAEDKDPRSAEYRQKLIARAEQFGIDPKAVEDMKDPFLVRIRSDKNLDPLARQQLVREMNVSDVEEMGEVEYAKSDATRMANTDIMDLFDPETGIDKAGNLDFRRAFLTKVVGTMEASKYLEGNSINQKGVTRVRNAIFALAYGKTGALENLAAATDDPARNITNALLRAAPRVAKVNAEISKGNLNDLSISKNMAEAADVLVAIRQNVDKVPAGMDPLDYYLKQGNLFERPSDETLDILNIYEKYKNSPKKIATIFDAYLDMVEDAGNPRPPNMFEGRPDVPSKRAALQAAIQELEGKYETAGIPGAGATPEPRGAGPGKPPAGPPEGPEGAPGPGEKGPPLTRYSVRGAFGLKDREAQVSRLETRLNELQDEYPGIDRDRAATVLRAIPQAENGQVANMVGDPELFNRVSQANLTAAEQKKILDQVLPGEQLGLFEGPAQGKMFEARVKAINDGSAFARHGLTTDLIQSRFGKNGTVEEMTPETLPANTNRGWVINEKSGSMVLIAESTEGSLKLGLGQTVHPDYAAMGITAADIRTMQFAGAHTPLPFNLGSFIELARGEGPRTLDHELWHRIEEFFLTPEERAKVSAKYGDNEELRAQAYAKWDSAKAPDTIFQKIKDFFTRIIKAITGHEDVDDIFAKARSGELFAREARERGDETRYSIRDESRDDAETRQMWTELEADPSFNRFKAVIDKNDAEIYRRLIMPGNREIPLYQGERFTPRAGAQIVETPGAKPRMLSKQEIYERMYDPKRPLQQPEGTQAMGRAPLLEGLEGTVAPPPSSKPGRLDIMARSLKEKLSVQSISKIAEWAHRSVVEHMGWSAREMIKAATVLGKYSKLFDNMAPEELYAFEENRLDDLVRDGKMTEERRASLDEAAQAWRRLSDGFHYLTADAKGGEFAYWQEYFPRLFQNPEMAQDVIGDYLKARGRRGGGGAGFLKPRTQLTLAQSIKPKLEARLGADGRVEVTQRDIYDGTVTPVQTFENEADARAFIEKEGGLGLKLIDPNYATVMKGNIWEKARWLQDNYIKDDLEESGFIKKGRQSGWVPVPDRGIWKGYYAHPDVASVIEKHLSPGIRNDPLFKAYYEPFTFMNEVFVGFSAFHASFSTLSFLSQGVGMNLPRAIGAALRGDAEAAKFHLGQLGKTLNVVQSYKEASKYIAQYGTPGAYPELEPIVDLLQKGGVRIKTDAFAKVGQSFADALRESKVSYPRSVVRLFASPIMNGIVPHFKMIADARRLENELFYARRQAQAEGRTLGKDELTALAQKITREGDNIFGQMVYDNLGMTRTWKDMLSLYIGFPGWNLGSFKMIGDAMRGIGHLTGETARYGAETLTGRKTSWRSMKVEQRMGMEFFAGMTLVMALGGTIIQRLLSGKWPESGKDLFMPQTGAILPNGEPERVRMPTYLRDVLSLNHPLEMIAHKQAFPLRLAQEFIANQDYFGTQIRDPWAPVGEQAKQTIQFAGRSFLPFGIQGVLKTEDPRAKVLNLIGITKVPRVYTNSPAANIIDEYNQLSRASTTTKETAEVKKLKSSLSKMARENDAAGFEKAASQAVSEGKLTRQQIKEIVNESEAPPGMSRFTKLPLEWKLRTWDAASDYEKQQWRPYLLKAVFQEKPETIIKLREPLEAALREDGLDEAADAVAGLTMPEKPLAMMDLTGMDLTGLGLRRVAPEMQVLDLIDANLAQSIAEKLNLSIKKPAASRISMRPQSERKRRLGLLGF